MTDTVGDLYEGNCIIVNYVLSTGQKGTLPLNKEQCKYFLDCIDKNKTMILQIGDEIRTLNPHHVAFTYLKGMKENEIVIKSHEAIEEAKETEFIQKIDAIEELSRAYNKPKELFKIECKCGEEYYKELPFYTQKNSCEKCSQMVFVDRKKGKLESANGLVWLITNRYFVEREFSMYKTTI
jgi:hypothetical protein